MDQRGVADRFLAEGQVAQVAMFGTTVLDMSDFPTRHPELPVLGAVSAPTAVLVRPDGYVAWI